MNENTDMGMIEFLWERYTSSANYQSKPEPDAAKEMRAQLESKLGGEPVADDVMASAYDYAFEMEKEGFILGFKTAMRLAAETFLKGEQPCY